MELNNLYKKDIEVFKDNFMIASTPSDALITTENGGSVLFNGMLYDGRVKISSGTNIGGKAVLAFPNRKIKVSADNWYEIAMIKRHFHVETGKAIDTSGKQWFAGLQSDDGSVFVKMVNYCSESGSIRAYLRTSNSDGTTLYKSYDLYLDNYVDTGIILRGNSAWVSRHNMALTEKNNWGKIPTFNGVELYPIFGVENIGGTEIKLEFSALEFECQKYKDYNYKNLNQ